MPPVNTTLTRAFGRPHVFLPVFHFTPAVPPLESLALLVNEGVHGVFLINQGARVDEVLAWARTFCERYPSLWVGVNLLGLSPLAALSTLRAAGLLQVVRGLWTDHAGLGWEGDPRAPRITVPRATTEFAKAVRETGLVHFGGVAFKGQGVVPPAAYGPLATQAAHVLDVVTTSGPATGEPPDLPKIQTFADALRGLPTQASLGIASGMCLDNLGDYLPHAQAFLVASGIERDFGVFDPVAVRAVRAKIEAGA